MTRSPRRLLPLVALICGLSLFGLSRVEGGVAAQAPDTIVEEVRQAVVDGHLVEKTAIIDTRLANDPVALADEVTGIPHETGGVTAQYLLNPRKWRPTALPVRVSYNPGIEAPRPSIAPAIANAVQQWSAVSPSTFTFVSAGTTAAGTDACDDHTDGVNTVAYVTTLQAGVLGLTCTYYTADDPSVILEFDMQLNWTFDWGAGPTIGANQYDLASTVLHEFGHAAGLGHTCPFATSSSCTPSDIAAVMYPALKKATLKRTLTADDISGLRAQYPGGDPLVPPPAPTPTPVPSPTLAPATTPSSVPIPRPGFSRDYQLVTPGVVRE